MAQSSEPTIRRGNRSLSIGANILSVFFLVNALPGLGSVGFIASGNHAPALRYVMSAAEIARADPRVIAAADGIALLLNTLLAAYCGLAFVVVRRCLLLGQRGSLVALMVGVGAVQVAGYVSDRVFFGGENVLVLHCSSVVFLTGLWLSARGLPRLG